MISIYNVLYISTEKFFHNFPGLPLPAKLGSLLLMQILYKKGVSREGSVVERFPRPNWNFTNICDKPWLYACKAIFADQRRMHTVQENAEPAAGSLCRADKIDKDEEFREFTD